MKVTYQARRASPDDLSDLLRRDTSPWRTARPVLLVILLIVGIGGLLGFIAHRITDVGQGWPITVTEIAGGYRVSSKDGLAQSGPALSDRYLAWLNGKCLELLDLRSGKTTLLEPPPPDGSDGLPAVISDRYVAWIASSGPNTAEDAIHAYDLLGRRRIVVANIGNLDGAIALGHGILYWQSHTNSAPNVQLIKARDLASGRSLVLAAGKVQLIDASADLVVWTEARGRKGSFELTVVKDIVSGRTWRLRLCPENCDMDSPVLSGRTLVWQLVPQQSDSSSPPLVSIDALDLDSRVRRVVAKGPTVRKLAARDGRILWTRQGQYFVQDTIGGKVQALNLAWRLTGYLPVISTTMVAGELGLTKDGGASGVSVVRTTP